MAGMPRESGFMPTIKCSSCGLQVEISMMGEHLCTGPPDMPSTQGPSSFDNFMPEKLPRMMPPSLDTSAANRSFAGQGQLTPVSMSSGSRGESPKTPNGRLGPGRSDDYFSPRIASDSPPGQSMRRPGGYGGFSEPDSYEVEPSYPGPSPNKPATNLLQRMNTIAPGPFEAGRRPSAPRNALQTRNAPEEYDRPGTAMSNLSSSSGSMRGPPRAPRKNGYGGFGPPQRAEDELEPKVFGAQRSDTFPRPSDPIDTPARTPSAPGPRPDRWRRPSDVSTQPMPMNGMGMRRPSKDTSRAPPPRTSLSRSKTSGSSSSSGSVNVAAEFGIGNPYHAPSDSMSSSVSGYSQASARPSQASSQSSLSRSAGSSFDRKQSDLGSMMDNLRAPTDERSRQQQQQQRKELPLSPMQPPPFDKNTGNKPFSKTLARRPPPPPQGYDPRIDPRPRRAPSPLASPAMEMASATMDDMYTRDDPAIQAPRRNRSPAPPPPPVMSSPERPMTRSRSRPRSPPPSDFPSRSPPRSNTAIQSRSRSRPRDRLPSQPQPPPTQSQSRSRSRPRGDPSTTLAPRSASGPRAGASSPPPLPSTSRGDCKSCLLPITGKSISSADGRLTGRYHKACFVCTTCQSPFSSSTFYVLDDRPYCEQHYHSLNGSLCGGCGNGIEGQYLEDETAKKHHPGCFRCGDCGVVLKDGYFEVAGAAYCEKDAWRRVQQPWIAGGGERKRSGSPLGVGLPSGPAGGMRNGAGVGGGSFGLPSGGRVPPGSQGMGFVPRPRMEKRMTRLGMM